MRPFRLLGAILIAIAAATAAMDPEQVRATAFSVDQSDLYYNAGESGWGMQLVQRGPVIFVTIFVYDTNRVPIWYTATLTPAGNLLWTGDLYLTNGSWFGTVPFDATKVTHRKVGTMTWDGAKQSVAYSVDGVAVSKTVVRQTLVYDDYSGMYLGAIHIAATGCTDSANNGVGEGSILISIAQTGQAITIALSDASASITITGTLSQAGQFGTVVGNYNVVGLTFSSTPSEFGNATVTNMNVQSNAFSATLSFKSTNLGCQEDGYIGGIRRMPS